MLSMAQGHTQPPAEPTVCAEYGWGLCKVGLGVRGLRVPQLKTQPKEDSQVHFPKTAVRGTWRWDRWQRNPREREKGWIQSTEKGEME